MKSKSTKYLSLLPALALLAASQASGAPPRLGSRPALQAAPDTLRVQLQAGNTAQGWSAYDSTESTYISRENPLKNYGNSKVLHTRNTSLRLEKTLLRFPELIGANPGQVPPGAYIRRAVLSVCASGASTDKHWTHRAITAWSAGSGADSSGADWSRTGAPEQSPGHWAAPGGLSGADYSDAPDNRDAVIPSVRGAYQNFDVRSGVQVWAEHPDSNFGWFLLNGTGGSDPVWWSALADPDKRPTLTVVYSTEPDQSGPAKVGGLTAAAGDSRVSLGWSAPPDADFDGVVVVRSTSGFPASPQDGLSLAQGWLFSLSDSSLVNGTRYYYSVFAYDFWGNWAAAATVSATPTADAVPPRLSRVRVLRAGPDNVLVAWSTDEPCRAGVDYGLAGVSDHSTGLDSSLGLEHYVTVTGLIPGAAYSLRPVASDRRGNRAVADTILYVTTLAAGRTGVRSDHPRLIISPELFPDLLDRVNGEYAQDYAGVKSYTANDPYNAAFVALVETLKGTAATADYDRAYNAVRQFAVDRPEDIIAVSTNLDWDMSWATGRSCRRLALVYDWLYDYLSADQRAFLRQGMVNWVTVGLTFGQYKPPLHNMYQQNFAGVVMAVLALQGDPDLDPSLTADWLAKARAALELQIEAVNLVGEGGGGWHEGYSYFWGAAGLNFPPELEAWRTATGEDVFGRLPALRELALHLMYLSRPQDNLVAHVDKLSPSRLTARTDEPTSGRHAYWSLLAARYRDCYAAQYAATASSDLSENYWPGPASRQKMWDLIWQDRSVQAQAAGNSLPGTRLFKGQGLVVMRSGFEDKSDVFAVFRARQDYGYGNRLACENSFLLHRNSALAIRSGYYNGWESENHLNYYGSDLPGNTLEIIQPGVQFGGQRTQQGNNGNHSPVTLTLESEADHDLAYGDATNIYATATNAERYFVRLKPEEYFVVFDRATARDRAFQKKWVLHSVNRPALSEPGSLEATEVADHITRWRAGLVTVDNGAGRLYCRTLLPAGHRVRVVGGAGYEFWVDSDNRNYPLGRIEESEAGAWRFEVLPDSQSLGDEFLHLLYPAASPQEAAPAADLIQAETFCGLRCGARVVLFSRSRARLDSLSYSLDSTQPLRHLLADLAPGSYQVLRDGEQLGVYAASSAGTVSFESAGGGSFTLRQASRAGIFPSGDLNRDNRLDIFDLLGMLKLLSGSAGQDPAADLNADGKVDVFDLLRMLKLLAE
ncbi:DNRLRE domain-containing protein [bacterium]|nr:DNRLRE domain-containing protein [bacterium]